MVLCVSAYAPLSVSWEAAFSACRSTHRRTQRAFFKEPISKCCPEEDLSLHALAPMTLRVS